MISMLKRESAHLSYFLVMARLSNCGKREVFARGRKEKENLFRKMFSQGLGVGRHSLPILCLPR